MSDLGELYQEVIFDHYRRPRNRGVLAGANRKAAGYNPLCGDKVTLYLKVEDGVVKDVSFEGTGCAIATASASLMTEALKGKTEAEAQALFGRFHEMVTASSAVPQAEMGKLSVLSGVREFPARVKCATLAWHTLQAALHGEDRTVSTEE
ncbi:SUF system NifU family Fe-S cluster assembly protein [Paraburkholderia dipogonis]|uniref:SUF system NifU family Fe-S cluster assembly protein n=1 Tax=Paraburkholderia dipogonis TaxID=1211383 RepID=A0A4Y8MG93_9BURK|nr:SUF system NifU family Fe-S cluster assembly protein [Paraburkholderia dipogonis]TFE36457.1 SUF system NifU family Fe-S cluster assembly protein [Paraburkholderia dipogonis]